MGELGLGGASDELLRDLKAEILRFMEHLQNIDAPAIPHHVQLLGSQLLLHQQLIQLLVLQHRLRMKFRLHSLLFLSIYMSYAFTKGKKAGQKMVAWNSTLTMGRSSFTIYISSKGK